MNGSRIVIAPNGAEINSKFGVEINLKFWSEYSFFFGKFWILELDLEPFILVMTISIARLAPRWMELK